MKVLITGPWSELSGRYSCVFDQTSVPASLIQPGVLRCYCPGTHKHLDALLRVATIRTGLVMVPVLKWEGKPFNNCAMPHCTTIGGTIAPVSLSILGLSLVDLLHHRPNNQQTN